ncbi:transposase, MuDR, MULE transposase domain protein [Tanacetum coccineum]
MHDNIHAEMLGFEIRIDHTFVLTVCDFHRMVEMCYCHIDRMAAMGMCFDPVDVMSIGKCCHIVGVGCGMMVVHILEFVVHVVFKFIQWTIDLDIKRDGSHYIRRPAKYTLSGFTWAFKTWILEAYKERALNYYTHVDRHPRAVAWVNGETFYRSYLEPFFEGAEPIRRLRADAFEAKAEWWVSSRAFFDGHICEPPQIPTAVSNDLYQRVAEHNRLIKELQQQNVDQYKIMNSMNKNFKEYGLEKIRGSPYESFEMLPYYLHNLERKNKGTVTRIKIDEGVFEMLFIALGASIRKFVNHLRPLLIIDAAHLKGQYKGTNLVAVGMDGKNQIVPITFGICKGETGPCWSWWMSVLKECIGDNPNLLFISNKHASIALAVRNEFPLAFHAVSNIKHEITDWVADKVHKRKLKSALWVVNGIDPNLYQVYDGGRNREVNLMSRPCQCRKWQLSGIPCGHVIAVTRFLGLIDCVQFVADWFKKEKYQGTYAESIHYVGDMH